MTSRRVLNGDGTEPRFEEFPERASEIRALLEETRHAMARLLADVPKAPRRLRLQAGEVAVEVEWDGAPSETAAGGPSPAPVSGQAAGGAADGTAGQAFLTAPTVGVFYRSPQPGAPPFASVGDHVRPGQQVGIVEAMKLMIPVEADKEGTVTEVLAEDGEAVEYGARLFALAPEGG